MPQSDTTTIAIAESTKKHLEKRGSKGDTFDDIVVELLEMTEEHEASSK